MDKSPSVARSALLVFSLLSFSLLSEARCFYKFPRDCNPTPITDQDICNFHKVDNDLYRGSAPRCSGYAKLAQIGVRTVVNLQGGSEASIEHCGKGRPHLHFHFISFDINPFQTALTGVSDKKMRRLFAEIQRAPKPIFINCTLGKDRTGAVVAIYRMKQGEMSFDGAWQEALHYRFGSHFIGLRRTIDRYKNPQALRLLPAPDLVGVRPQSVCRAGPPASNRGAANTTFDDLGGR